MKTSKHIIISFILCTSLISGLSYAATKTMFKTKVNNESAVQVKVAIYDSDGKSVKAYTLNSGNNKKLEVWHGCNKTRDYSFTVQELQFNKIVTTGNYTLTTGKNKRKNNVFECTRETFVFTKCEDANSTDNLKTTCDYIYANNNGRQRGGKIIIKAD
ncbi:MAG: hypothetical protein L3J24_07880 [Xanthomonadales bacterium]|nr:hypothetical protein [Xanthomonadales bacterium]